jgi:hypothetical protein
MTEHDKKQLAKLSRLESKTAEQFLIAKAVEMNTRIGEIKDNDEIFDLLDLLNTFAVRVPDICIEIIDIVLSEKYEAKIIQSPFGDFSGKNHTDLVKIIIDILAHIRYQKPQEVLTRLVTIIKDKNNPDLVTSAKEVLSNFAKYDYFVLTKTQIGYGVQGLVLDFVSKYSSKEQIENFDIVEILLTELLSSEVEGTEWIKEDTLTFHSGAVTPNQYLIDLRSKSIKILDLIYFETEDVSIKLRIVNIFARAIRTPSSVAYKDELLEMLAADSKQIIEVFNRMLFSLSSPMDKNLPMAKEIDQTLYWFQKHETFATSEAKDLIERLHSDPLYSFFSLFMSSEMYFDYDFDAEGKRNRFEETSSLLNSINNTNIDEYREKINHVSAPNKYIDEWNYSYFKEFLKKLSITKPELASYILLDAFENNKPVKHFVDSFLDGFREANNLTEWDMFVQRIIEEKDLLLVSAISYSLIRWGDVNLNEVIRKSDIDLLEEIVRQTGKFSFLSTQTDVNYKLHHSIINALTRNFKLDERRLENLIIEEITLNPQCLELYFRELPIAVWKKYIDFSSLTPKGIEFIKSKLILIRDIDWNIQQVLLDLGRNDLGLILGVFIGRIEHQIKEKEGKKGTERLRDNYDPIPNHFNDELKKFIGEHPKYLELITQYLEDTTPEWSVYNWELGQLLEKIGASYKELLMSLIKKEDKDSLRKASYLMDTMDRNDIELCIEIVKRTDDVKILNKVEALLYSTGVVNGEDGIAKAYEARAAQLESYLTSEDKRLRNFSERMVRSFKESAKKEFERAAEQKQIRKIEFEG